MACIFTTCMVKHSMTPLFVVTVFTCDFNLISTHPTQSELLNSFYMVCSPHSFQHEHSYTANSKALHIRKSWIIYTRLLDEVYEMLCICIYNLFNNLTAVNTTWSSSNNTEVALSAIVNLMMPIRVPMLKTIPLAPIHLFTKQTNF